MFKSVEYTGFEGEPELLRLVGIAAALLPGEIRSFREDVRVNWTAHPGPPTAVELTLTLELLDLTGRGRRRMAVADFADEELLRSRIRQAWLDATGEFLEQRRLVWDELLREPVEV